MGVVLSRLGLASGDAFVLTAIKLMDDSESLVGERMRPGEQQVRGDRWVERLETDICPGMVGRRMRSVSRMSLDRTQIPDH